MIRKLALVLVLGAFLVPTSLPFWEPGTRAIFQESGAPTVNGTYSSDWNLDSGDSSTYSNLAITLNADLNVNTSANLTLDNTSILFGGAIRNVRVNGTLRLDHTAFGSDSGNQIAITVYDGGQLFVNNSQVTKLNSFGISNGANVEIRDSVLFGFGSGITVTSSTFRAWNSEIGGSATAGIIPSTAAVVEIWNTTVHNNTGGGLVEVINVCTSIGVYAGSRILDSSTGSGIISRCNANIWDSNVSFNGQFGISSLGGDLSIHNTTVLGNDMAGVFKGDATGGNLLSIGWSRIENNDAQQVLLSLNPPLLLVHNSSIGDGPSSGIEGSSLLAAVTGFAIVDNDIFDQARGIQLDNADTGTISRNRIYGHRSNFAINVAGSTHTIEDNLIHGNNDGLILAGTGHQIHYNTIEGMSNSALQIPMNWDGNSVTNNTFSATTPISYTTDFDSTFDGNYYSNYTDADTDGDFIGNTPFAIGPTTVDANPVTRITSDENSNTYANLQAAINASSTDRVIEIPVETPSTGSRVHSDLGFYGAFRINATWGGADIDVIGIQSPTAGGGGGMPNDLDHVGIRFGDVVGQVEIEDMSFELAYFSLSIPLTTQLVGRDLPGTMGDGTELHDLEFPNLDEGLDLDNTSWVWLHDLDFPQGAEAIAASNSSNLTIEDNTMTGWSSMITISGSENVTVERNSVSGPANAVVVGVLSTNVSVMDNVLSGFYGLSLSDSDQTTFQNNTVTSTSSGVSLDTVNDVWVINNNIDYDTSNGGNHGITADTTSGALIISGNTLAGPSDGVYFAGGIGDGVQIENNSINSSSATGIRDDSGGATDLHIANNTLWNANHGIYLISSTDATVVNNEIFDTSDTAILLEFTSGGVFAWNLIHNNSDDGFFLDSGTSAWIHNNTIRDSAYGFSGSSSNGDLIEWNTVYNTEYGVYLDRAQAYWHNNTFGNASYDGWYCNNAGDNNELYNNRIYDSGGDGIYFYDCYDIVIHDNLIWNNSAAGIEGDDYDGVDIMGNEIWGNSLGIDLYNPSSGGPTIGNNYIHDNQAEAIYLLGAGVTAIEDNMITNNGYAAIWVDNNQDTALLYNNTIMNHAVGIQIESTSNQIYIQENLFHTNVIHAVELDSQASSFQIDHNSFVNNGGGSQFAQANDLAGSSNEWYDSGSNEGNYWSDWTGPDSDGNGIVDTPYGFMGTGVYDPFPLTTPHHKSDLKASFTQSETTAVRTIAVVFTDTSTLADTSTSVGASIVRWDWDFGDGSSSTDQHPNHLYTTLGMHTITLTVTDSNGWTNSSSSSVDVMNIPPLIDFQWIPTMPIARLPVQFQEMAVDPDEALETHTWLWEFGDGTNSTLRNPSHVFDQAGTYIVNATITDSEGLVGIRTHTVTVGAGASPIAAFSWNPFVILTGAEVSFLDLSYDPDGTIVSWAWDFDDGGTSTMRHPVHNFTNPGSHNVSLTVTDDQDASGSITLEVDVMEFDITLSAPSIDTWAADQTLVAVQATNNGGPITTLVFELGGTDAAMAALGTSVCTVSSGNSCPVTVSIVADEVRNPDILVRARHAVTGEVLSTVALQIEVWWIDISVEVSETGEGSSRTLAVTLSNNAPFALPFTFSTSSEGAAATSATTADFLSSNAPMTIVVQVTGISANAVLVMLDFAFDPAGLSAMSIVEEVQITAETETVEVDPEGNAAGIVAGWSLGLAGIFMAMIAVMLLYTMQQNREDRIEGVEQE